MGAMGNRLVAGENAVRHRTGSQVYDIKPDVFAEADVGETIPAINGEGKHAAFANVVDVAREGIVVCAKDPKIGLGAEISELAVEAGDAVVCRRSCGQARCRT